MWIIITCIVFIALFNAEMDIIKYHPKKALFQNDWWLLNGNINRNWWMRVPFSMFLDGWHLCKFFMRLSESVMAAYTIGLILNLSSLNIIFLTILVYAAIGGLFELSYGRDMR